MPHVKRTAREVSRRLLPSADGAGPLLQRDYWGVIRECRLTAPEVAALLRERFTDFPPESIVVFERLDDADRPLAVGDRLRVDFQTARRTAESAEVCVTHTDDNSLTLATVEGHPEAGRITFGAYPNARGDVVFHIRSRARSASHLRLAGFLTLGDAMQTNTWTDFIDRLAHSIGEGIVGAIYAETRRMEDGDDEPLDTPTFVARGE